MSLCILCAKQAIFKFKFQELQGIPVSAVNRDGYELQWDSVKKPIQGAATSLSKWEIWIPASQKASLEDRVNELKALNTSLEARREEFLTAQRIAEEERRRRAPPLPVLAHQPIVRIKPTSLPKFDGSKWNFGNTLQ